MVREAEERRFELRSWYGTDERSLVEENGMPRTDVQAALNRMLRLGNLFGVIPQPVNQVAQAGDSIFDLVDAVDDNDKRNFEHERREHERQKM